MKFLIERTSNKVPSLDRQPIAGATWDELRREWSIEIGSMAFLDVLLERAGCDMCFSRLPGGTLRIYIEEDY